MGFRWEWGGGGVTLINVGSFLATIPFKLVTHMSYKRLLFGGGAILDHAIAGKHSH